MLQNRDSQTEIPEHSEAGDVSVSIPQILAAQHLNSPSQFKVAQPNWERLGLGSEWEACGRN